MSYIDATAPGFNLAGKTADTAAEVASRIDALFGFSADADDVLLFAINNSNGTDSIVWRWADDANAGGDGAGDVDVSEIEALATLTDVTVDQLTSGDFV